MVYITITGFQLSNIKVSDFVGETIKIVIEDYVQHLSGYHFKLKFDPELLFKERFQYQNRIASEFNTLYHWHPLMPDSFHIEEKEYSYKEFVFNNSVVTRHGIGHLVDSFTKQLAGRVRASSWSCAAAAAAFCSLDPERLSFSWSFQVAGGRNVPKSLLYVSIKSIENSREMRYQSLNAYRKRFSMKPYSSFEEMTGWTETKTSYLASFQTLVALFSEH